MSYTDIELQNLSRSNNKLVRTLAARYYAERDDLRAKAGKVRVAAIREAAKIVLENHNGCDDAMDCDFYAMSVELEKRAKEMEGSPRPKSSHGDFCSIWPCESCA